MQSFRMTSSNPYWFEDLVFAVVDEGRRLPERASLAVARGRRHANTGLAALRRFGAVVWHPRKANPATSARHATARLEARAPVREAERLDEPLAWALATEPLATSEMGVQKVVELQDKAREQLGAITYVLDRIRDEIEPALTRPAAAPRLTRHTENMSELDTSIEALLALSRRNAALRPKERCLTAA